MTINATAAILLALYVAVAKRSGADLSKLAGTVQNDILKEYIARGTYIYPVPHAMRLVTDMFAWASQNLPEWNTISISGYHMREAGSTAAQEVAFTLANGITYVQAAIDAGLDVDSFAPRLSFFFNAHTNLLEEVAKFRAARRMWAPHHARPLPREESPRSWMLRFHAQTAGSTLTAQQPREQHRPHRHPGAGGGARRHAVACTPTASTKRSPCPPKRPPASRCAPSRSSPTRSGVAQTVDPSPARTSSKTLTIEIEQHARRLSRYHREHRPNGPYGMLRAIERGYVQQEIQNAAYDYQRGRRNRRDHTVVGVNAFTTEDERCSSHTAHRPGA